MDNIMNTGKKTIENTKIAYFTMETALKSNIPTYSGGLGVLAGDALRAAADIELPLVAVTLCYSSGYFYQMLDSSGKQIEHQIDWEFASELSEACIGDIRAEIILPIENKKMKVKAWEYDVIGRSGHLIKIYLLDSNVEGNEDWQKEITHVLYDPTPWERAAQEYILGVGGLRMLQALGYKNIETYHLNEGHASMLTLELIAQFKGNGNEVKKHCIFTTHTPVPAGHDKFDYDIIYKIFGGRLPANIRDIAGKDMFNTTKLAINMSGYVNGVSQKHGEITRKMFPGEVIDTITNGVHHDFWICKPISNVISKFIPRWRMHPNFLDQTLGIDNEDLWSAHLVAKDALIDYEISHSWILFDKKLLTIGFARRITEYKRPTLLFHKLERLAKIAQEKVQFVFAGKSHPNDMGAKRHIQELYDYGEELWDSYRVRIAFLDNYDLNLAKLLVSGVDVWLNTPIRYLEASGTSGMKAALNGVLNFSVLDGWWIEGYKMEPLAGWKIGPAPTDPNSLENNWDKESADLYDTLEKEIIPLYYQDRSRWIERMKHAIKLGSFFNTHRMMREYAIKAYKMEQQPRWSSTKKPL
ncbi:MAG: alpha-glucan family phosphorylase [Candidatus Hermodarchaeota archaeon]